MDNQNPENTELSISEVMVDSAFGLINCHIIEISSSQSNSQIEGREKTAYVAYLIHTTLCVLARTRLVKAE